MSNEDPDFVAEDKKLCPYCKQYKPLSQYYKRGSTSAYTHSYCKSCHGKAFRHNKIMCPHCNGQILMVGIDASGTVMHKTKDVFRKKKRKPRKPRSADDLDLKELFDD